MAEDAFCGAICGKGLDVVIEAIGYIWKYDDLVASLETDLENLGARLSTVNTEVIHYRDKQRRVIRDDVTLWIQKAGERFDEAEEFMETTKKNATGCCGQDCNWMKRYWDAKKAEEHSEDIKELKAGGEGFDKVYFRGLNPEPMAEFWGKEYVALPSMDETIEQLKGFLQAAGGSDEIPVVGIYGAKGVGKTTLAKKFAADMESDGVLKVVVANGKDNIKSIQSQIAERVGFEFTTESVTERAGSLYKYLSAMKVLIIFDNVDQKITLNVIGIPQPRLDNGCRILVVSTSSKACAAMHSKKNLEIKPLTQEEAKTFAAGLAIKHEWSKYSVVYISYNETWLPAEIEHRMCYESTRRTKSLSFYIQRAVFAAMALSSLKKASPSSGGGGTNTILLNADALDITHKDKPRYWKLDPSKSSPEAVLVQAWFLNIEGKAMGLLPDTNYGAYFVYQLSNSAKGFNINPMEMIVGRNSRSCYLDQSKSSNNKPTERDDEWLEIEMGIFYSDDYAYSPVDLIIRDHDTSIVKSGLSIHGIELRQLIATPSSGDGITSFLLNADALQIAHKDNPKYWYLDCSNSSPEAVLIIVWFLSIEGKAMELLPKTNYGAYFVYQLSDDAEGFNTSPVEMIVGRNSKLCYLDPSKSSNDKFTERVDKWLEIEMGIFYSDDYADSSVDLIIKNHDTSFFKSGLRVHGIEIRQTILLLGPDALDIAHKDNPIYWRLDRSEFSSEAVLLLVWFLDIHGKATGLFPGTNYGAYFVYQLSDNAYGFTNKAVEMVVGINSKRCYLDPSISSNEKPREREDKWLEIEMGRFYSDDYAYSPVSLIVKDHDDYNPKSGLHVLGIELRQLGRS